MPSLSGYPPANGQQLLSQPVREAIHRSPTRLSAHPTLSHPLGPQEHWAWTASPAFSPGHRPALSFLACTAPCHCHIRTHNPGPSVSLRPARTCSLAPSHLPDSNQLHTSPSWGADLPRHYGVSLGSAPTNHANCNLWHLPCHPRPLRAQHHFPLPPRAATPSSLQT